MITSEPKPFASLTSGLLARKGTARPAMRPQGFGQLGTGLEDLGWNDLGFEAPKPSLSSVHDAYGDAAYEPPLRNPVLGLSPAVSPVHEQQAEFADRLAASEAEDEGYEIAETEDIAEITPTSTLVAILPAEPVETIAPAYAEMLPAVAVERMPTVAVEAVRAVAGAKASKAKAAFTLRLDADRHLKLRLACAVSGRSAQQLVTGALDNFLASMPQIDSLAAQAPEPVMLTSRKR